MQVYPCGTTVKTTIGSIECIITGICIRFGKVQYEISHFNEGKYEVNWVAECEFVTAESKTNKIGFK